VVRISHTGQLRAPGRAVSAPETRPHFVGSLGTEASENAIQIKSNPKNPIQIQFQNIKHKKSQPKNKINQSFTTFEVGDASTEYKTSAVAAEIVGVATIGETVRISHTGQLPAPERAVPAPETCTHFAGSLGAEARENTPAGREPNTPKLLGGDVTFFVLWFRLGLWFWFRGILHLLSWG
jgi:hypothetical protein